MLSPTVTGKGEVVPAGQGDTARETQVGWKVLSDFFLLLGACTRISRSQSRIITKDEPGAVVPICNLNNGKLWQETQESKASLSHKPCLILSHVKNKQKEREKKKGAKTWSSSRCLASPMVPDI